jgi:hypothetical protein
MTVFVASGVDPSQRIAELDGLLHAVDVQTVNPNDLLGELRFRLDAVERCPSLTLANLHRECVCRVMFILDRFITLGGELPHAWRHAGGRR